jgi:hypothetical protein
MTREEAAEFTRKLLARAETIVFPKTPKTINNIPVFYFEAVLSALRSPTPDPDTGLMPCGWCGPERIGWFNVQFWARASTGKRKWMSVTQQYKKQVNYCPMCGRKLEVDDD